MAASWLDTLREWNYSLKPVFDWFVEIVLYNAERHGPIAYVITFAVIASILMAFPPTRGITKAVIGGLFKASLTYFQIVLSLVTVQLAGGVAKVSLSLFHKARIWVLQMYEQARNRN